MGRGADRQEAIGNNPKMLPADLRNHDLPGYLYVRGAPPCARRPRAADRPGLWGEKKVEDWANKSVLQEIGLRSELITMNL